MEVGGIESLYGGIYEVAHKRLKHFNSRSSQRKELRWMQNAESSKHFKEFIGNRTSVATLNGFAI